jgi:hypothetical protein
MLRKHHHHTLYLQLRSRKGQQLLKRDALSLEAREQARCIRQLQESFEGARPIARRAAQVPLHVLIGPWRATPAFAAATTAGRRIGTAAADLAAGPISACGRGKSCTSSAGSPVPPARSSAGRSPGRSLSPRVALDAARRKFQHIMSHFFHCSGRPDLKIPSAEYRGSQL